MMAGARVGPVEDQIVAVADAATEGAQDVRRAYPAAKLARLMALKDVYASHNVFHLNHNIRLSTSWESPGRGLG
ncbi:hypothetical protein B0I32_13928 [Nonomuraea fuscirosea]|uniref:Uncharacterized protein n=1 Tax=Nonomuraea fuscirosea TaxID=1291556 RepID=A0A2T0LXT3_9ACTN|nr:hypothetical protein B0I32_13928 [Nonomuraea fuscirosea]